MPAMTMVFAVADEAMLGEVTLRSDGQVYG
jgi:Cu/Ag efflux protein CusF